MNGRVIFRVLALLLVVAVAAGIGTVVYNAGVNAGLDEAARLAVASADGAMSRSPSGATWVCPSATIMRTAWFIVGE